MGSSINLDAVARKISREQARFHQETVADLLKRPNVNFPGAQPVSFARKHLFELERTDYFVAEKTDGIRCLLYLTTVPNEHGEPTEAQFLIDRKNDYYHVEPGYLHIPPINVKPTADNPKPYHLEHWHNGTILDGELVRDRHKNGKEELTFLVFDMLALDNECITHRTYDSRVGKIGVVLDPLKAFMHDWPGEAAVMRFQLRRKDPQLGYAAEMMFRDVIPKLTHGNDGLIYTCRSTPYVAGTDEHILKWKPPHENTIDFRLQLGSFPVEEDDEGAYEDFDQKPEVALLVFHGNNRYEKYADLFLTDEEWEAMKTMNEAFDWRIIECWREATTGRWRPKLDDGNPRFRDDKDHANHISTVNSVLESIEDAVSEQDLIDAAGRIKAAWKERSGVAAAQKREHEQRKREAMKAQQAQEAAQRASAANNASEVKKEEDDQPRYED